jgi:hypothetical protein
VAEQGNVSDSVYALINSSNNCQTSSSNGDFEVQMSNTVNPMITFIPGSPITGCTYVLIYPSVNGKTLGGYYMTQVGNDYVYTVTAALGETVSWYFTYEVPSGGERNSLANPNQAVVGDCSTLTGIQNASSKIPSDNLIEIYPVPFTDWLTVNFESNRYNSLTIIDMNGRVMLFQNIQQSSNSVNLNVNMLSKGVYYLRLEGNTSTTGRVIVK